MKKFSTLFISAIIVALSLTASKPTSDEKSMHANFSFTKNGDSEVLIQIKFKEDNSFEYLDRSDPSKVINTSGNYILKGNKVKLSGYVSQYSIPERWTLDKNNQCIKNRKALKFTRICNCD